MFEKEKRSKCAIHQLITNCPNASWLWPEVTSWKRNPFVPTFCTPTIWPGCSNDWPNDGLMKVCCKIFWPFCYGRLDAYLTTLHKFIFCEISLQTTKQKSRGKTRGYLRSCVSFYRHDPSVQKVDQLNLDWLIGLSVILGTNAHHTDGKFRIFLHSIWLN